MNSHNKLIFSGRHWIRRILAGAALVGFTAPSIAQIILCHRRLHRGGFIWPGSDEAVCTLSEPSWNWLVAGVDWQRLQAPAPSHWRM